VVSPAAAAPPPRSLPGWLRGITGPRVLVLLAAVVAGFLLVGQVEGERADAPQPLEAESEADLARILAGLNAEADALQSEIAELKVQLSELQRSSQSEAAASEAIDEQLRTLQVLAGTSPVTGPGVVVVVTDPERAITYDALIDMVQELRDAGAEAVAVNEQRVGVASAFAERDKRITLNGVVLEGPYRVHAIGQPAVDALRALRGVKVEVQRQAKVDIPALARPPQLRAARPVGSNP
jgi:uncharacterized protein YlxW (UPF0749 family)